MKIKEKETKIEKETLSAFGDNNQVNPVEQNDYNDYLNLPKKSQVLPGFDDQYKDIVDYVLKITHRIWEEKSLGTIYDTYHNNVVMHFGSSNAVGIDKVIKGTLETLHTFPDRKLIGQNVIWTPYKKLGFLSSHRIISTATNLNDGAWGKATYKKVHFRTAVDCAVENNRIYEEWLVRDNLWIIKQLGYDAHKIAYNLAIAQLSGEKNTTHHGLGNNMKGQFFPEKYIAKDDSISEFVKEMVNSIYNYRYFDKVIKYYSKNAVIHYICDEDLTGHNKIQGMLVNFFASFPNANMLIEKISINEKPEANSYDVALRWRLNGVHEGYGMFGSPSNQPISILGINHYIIKDKKITEEWVTYDALDVWKQIYLKIAKNKTCLAVCEKNKICLDDYKCKKGEK